MLPYVYCLFYLLFTFSGMIKWIPFPVDPMIIFGGILVLLILVRLKKIVLSKGTLLMFVLFISFYIWLAFTSIYSVSPSFYKEKIILVLPSLMIYLFPALLFKDDTFIKAFDRVFNTMLVVTLVLMMFLYATGIFDILTTRIEDSKIPNYLKTSLFLGLGVLINFNKPAVFNKILIGFSIFFMIMLGGRGPVLLLGIVLLPMLYRKLKRLDFSFMSLLVTSLVLSIGVYYIGKQPEITERLVNRISSIQEGDNSSLERVNDFYESTNTIINNPVLGVGNGGYGYEVASDDSLYYPHNLILEIWAELGIIGLIIFVIFLLYQFKINKIIQNTYSNLYYNICFWYIFLETLITGSLVDMRIMVIWLALTLALYNIKNTSENRLQLV